MEIISFTMDFERQRLIIRFADNTEKCIQYREIYPRLKKPVKASEKQIEDEIKRRVKKISDTADLKDEEKKKMITRIQATSEREKIQKFVENELSAEAADIDAKKTITDIAQKMRSAIAQIIDAYNNV